MKDELTSKAEEVGNMHQEVVDMEDQMETLEESHKYVFL